MKFKLLSTLLFCSLFANFSWANGNHIYKNLDYLNLKTKQKKEIKDILVSYKDDFKEYYEKKAQAQKELKELMRDDNFSKIKYEDIAEEVAEEAIELEAELLDDIHKVLTPNQRKKFSRRLLEWRIE